MVTEDYVSFETAKLLKEKGFNYPTYFYWDLTTESKTPVIGVATKPKDFNHKWQIFTFPISCPTLQMAMKWLREEYNIDILITIGGFIEKGKVYFCSVYKNLINYGDLKECSTYEEAVEAAIKYCLENLVK